MELPYEGDNASMLVVLPQEVEGLNSIMQKLADGYDLIGAVDKMFSTKTQVWLPKFKIETKIDLKNLLPKVLLFNLYINTHTPKSGWGLFISNIINDRQFPLNMS